MAREKYQDWNPSDNSRYLLVKIHDILTEYKDQGYRLTLRQLYYQLVARDIIPNSVREYHRIGNVVNRGRLAGYIDWDMIEDRVRVPQSNAHWDSPKAIMDAAINSYYRDRWTGQKEYVEVWCEKDAVSNILQPVCSRYDVTFMANRGYSSQTAMYDGSKRLRAAHAEGKKLNILYFGDHDPSGMDMTRDIADRLGVFLLEKGNSVWFVDRVALNMDQVEEYDPPENPAKVTDSRFEGYVKIYGDSSWELDALEPSVLAEMVETKIRGFIDDVEWNKVINLEIEHKARLEKLAETLEDEDETE